MPLKFNIKMAALVILLKELAALQDLNPELCSEYVCVQPNVRGSFVSVCAVPNDPNAALIYSGTADIEID
jgi:hypothetical protein